LEDLNTPPSVWRKGARPNYMRQADWVPCGCGRCYHCNNKLTTGVAHKGSNVAAKNSTEATSECSTDRTTMPGGPRACKVCMDKLAQDKPMLIYKERQLQASSTRKGCPACQVWVCGSCWSDFKHKK
jgi:hypothetical protein